MSRSWFIAHDSFNSKTYAWCWRKEAWDLINCQFIISISPLIAFYDALLGSSSGKAFLWSQKDLPLVGFSRLNSSRLEPKRTSMLLMQRRSEAKKKIWKSPRENKATGKYWNDIASKGVKKKRKCFMISSWKAFNILFLCLQCFHFAFDVSISC